MARNDAVQTAINQMKAARHGGDYAAIFQGKRLAFKLSAIKEATSELMEASEDTLEAIEPVAAAVAESSIGQAVLALGALVADAAAPMFDAIRAAFHGLLEVFEALRDALTAALGPIMTALGMALDAVINLLIDLLPNVIFEFIRGLVAAVLPFIGQIKACGSMLLSVAEVVSQAVNRYLLSRAAEAIDTSNRFATAARNAMDRILNRQLADAGMTAVLDTGNAAASVSGLIWTGNVGSMVAGIAVAVAKLCIKVADVLHTVREMRAGNALLEQMRNDPRRDVNPAELFKAAPVLGACYLAIATQSSLIANTGFLDSLTVRLSFTDDAWMSAYEAKARELSPYRLRAMQYVNAHPLELTASAIGGVYIDLTTTDVLGEAIAGAVADRGLDVLEERFV